MSIRGLWKAFLVSAIIPLSSLTFSDVVIVVPENDHALHIAQKIQTKIDFPTLITHTLRQDTKADVVVALGRDSLNDSIGKTESPIVGSFVNSSDFNHQATGTGVAHVVYADPAPANIARFLKHHFKNTKVGFIYTEEDEHIVSAIRSSLANSPTRLVAIRHDGDTFSGIRKLTERGIDVMLIGNNRAVYTPGNIRFVLESLFRKKIPVVAVSKSLVKAGATVSVTPYDEDIIEETSRAVNLLLSPSPDVDTLDNYVEGMEISVNKAMSELYNLHVQEGSK